MHVNARERGVQKRAVESLERELEVVVSHCRRRWEPSQGCLEERYTLLTSGIMLQLPFLVISYSFKNCLDGHKYS